MSEKKIFKNSYLPFLVLLAVQVLYHLFLKENANSDAMQYFGRQLQAQTLLEFLRSRYYGWSSRLIIEALLVHLSSRVTLWKIIDTILWIVFAYFLSEIFNPEKDARKNWIITGIVLLFPFEILSSAGWIATTMNYTWPLFVGTYVFVLIARIYRGEKWKVWHLLLGAFAIVFAANVEQMCVVLLFALAAILIDFACVQKRQLKEYFPICIFEVLTTAELIFILTCPGNGTRTGDETAAYFQNFASLNLIDKLNLGLVNTMYRLMHEGALLYMAFALLLAAVVFMKTKETWIRVVSLVPISWELLMTVARPYVSVLFGSILSSTPTQPTINGTNYHQGSSYATLLIYGMILVSIIAALCYISKTWTEAILQITAFVVGFGSRLMMGFAPTLIPSSMRTFTFFYGSMMFGILLLLHTNQEEVEGNAKVKSGIEVFLGIAVVVTFIQGLIAAGTF